MTKAIEKTAYHEAGHAVASYFHHIPFSSITIIPEEDCLGCLKHPEPKNPFHEFDDITLKKADWIEKMILVRLTGQIAEWKFANRHNWKGSGEDWHWAIEEASLLMGGGEVLQKYMDYMWARAKTLFNVPWCWTAIEAVAKELLIRKKMENRLTRKIIKKAISDYAQKRGGD